MYTKMRRVRQELDEQDTRAIMERGTAGVLALSGCEATGGFAYGVPLSYVYVDETAWNETLAADGLAPWNPADGGAVGRIFFHGARSGTKLDAIAADGRATFTVIDQDCIVPEEYTTYFRSAMAFGHARVMADDTERLHALELLAAKYSPELPEGRAEEIRSQFGRTAMIELAVMRLTGKEAIELVRARE